MNIYFTLPPEIIEFVGKELEGVHTDIETVRLPSQPKEIIRHLKKYIEERLLLLKEEIDSEEVLDEDVYTLMNFSKDPLTIQYLGYSHKLTSKMETAITPEDFVFIEKVLRGLIKIDKS